MTQINSRPPFFPHSSSSGSAKTKHATFSSDIASNRTNSAERIEELNTVTGDHVKVDIPESIKDYAAIKKAVDNAPPMDNSAKVAALKKQIQDGTYKVDYDAVADKMLESEF
jgi:negative regulator of flagellin synthesis FlgM